MGIDWEVNEGWLENSSNETDLSALINTDRLEFLEMVSDREERTQKDRAEEIGVSPATVSNYVNTLEDAGFLRKVGHGQYSSTSQAERLLNTLDDLESNEEGFNRQEWRQNLGNGFDIVFDDKNSLRALNRIGIRRDHAPTREVFTEDKEKVEDQSEDRKTLREVPETVLGDLSDSQKIAFVGAVRGWDNEKIADLAEYSAESSASSAKHSLKERGLLRKQGGTRHAEYFVGSKALEPSMTKNSQTDNVGKISQDRPGLGDISEEAIEDLDFKETNVLVGAIRGWSNEKTAEIVDKSEGYIGQIKLDLKNRGLLEKEGKSSAATWYPGSEILSTEDEKKKHEDKYSITEVLSHLSGNADLLEDQDAQYLEAETDLDEHSSEVFDILNSHTNLKVLRNLQDYNSITNLADENDLEVGEVENSLEQLQSVNVVSLSDHEYIPGFEVREEYNEILEAFKSAYRGMQELNDLEDKENFPDLNKTEEIDLDIQKVFNHLKKGHKDAERALKLFSRSKETNKDSVGQKNLKFWRDRVEAEDHRITEYSNPEDILKGGDLINLYLEEEGPNLTEDYLREMNEWNEEFREAVNNAMEDYDIGRTTGDEKGEFIVFLQGEWEKDTEIDGRFHGREDENPEGAAYGSWGDVEENRKEWRQENSIFIGERIEGGGRKFANGNDGYKHQYHAEEIEEFLESKEIARYDELAAETGFSLDTVKNTCVWMRESRGDINLHEEGVVYSPSETTQL